MPQDEGVIPAKLGNVSMLGGRSEPVRKVTPNLKGLPHLHESLPLAKSRSGSSTKPLHTVDDLP
jgi:hypothetical protein